MDVRYKICKALHSFFKTITNHLPYCAEGSKLITNWKKSTKHLKNLYVSPENKLAFDI